MFTYIIRNHQMNSFAVRFGKNMLDKFITNGNFANVERLFVYEQTDTYTYTIQLNNKCRLQLG